MIVKAELKCRKCDHKAKYNSTEINFDHVICKKCGRKIGVIKWLDQVNMDYLKVGNTVIRRNPKKKMRKKDRRRERGKT